MKTKSVNGFGIRQGWNIGKYKGRIKQGSQRGSAAVKRKTRLKPVFIIYLVAALSLSAFAPMGEAQSQSDLGGCSVIVDGSRLSIIGTEAPNTIHVAGSERGVVQVTCDGASDTFTGIEEITVEGRDGDDRVTIDDSNGLLGGLAINVFSQGSADLVLLVVLPMLPLFEVIGITFVGAFGPDVLQIAAGPLADRFDITPDAEANSGSVEVSVTDIASGRQVANISGKKLEDLTVQMGDGNDEANISPLSGITTHIFGEDGNDRFLAQLALNIVDFVDQDDYDGGAGVDMLQITTGAREDKFDIASGPDPNSVEVRVTDIATETPLADISGSELEELTVEAGDGDDTVNIDNSNGLLSGIAKMILGGNGDDHLAWIVYLLPMIDENNLYDGAAGNDTMTIVGGSLAERFDIAPGAEANSVEVQLTDIASGRQFADISGSELEELTVEAGDGDDEVSVDNTSGLLGGIAISALGQGGDDRGSANVYSLVNLREPSSTFFELGPGEDDLIIESAQLGDRFDIVPGADANSVAVQVTDIASGRQFADISGSELEELTVKMGDGNDQANVTQVPGMAVNILGAGGDDRITAYLMASSNQPGVSNPISIDGGPGEDLLQITTGPRDDQFDVRRGEAEDAVDVQVTDIATGTVTADIVAAAVEETLIKMGAGNDILNKLGNLPTLLSAFGEEGDDTYSGVPFPGSIGEDIGSSESYLSGGTGYDKFTYNGTTAAEQYEIVGVPDLTIPDPELRVTDMVTGLELAHVQFLDVEDVTIEAGDSDDRVEVNCDAALMSGLTLLRVDLGRGNDSFLANLLPVRTEPPTREVQTAQFELDAGPGNDQVAFSHFAGSWFDVFFTAATGPGADTVNALLAPPPEGDIPAPEGLRQLQFNMVTGGNDDLVRLENQTSGEFFNVSFYADLEGGNDTFEGRGEIHDANILPGRGFDTARVTPNFRPFVSQFESIVILE